MNGSHPFLESNELDMTPLIDCVMLLLVFFMITTAFFAMRGLEVVMPSTSGAPAKQVDTDVNVYIAPSGAIQVRGTTVDPRRLGEVFKEAFGTGEGKALVLEAARTVKHDRVILVMDLAKEAGLREVIFARMEEEDGP